MNGRRLFREYAISKGQEAKEFVTIEKGVFEPDTLITKNNSGDKERLTLDYKDMVNWIIKTVKCNV